MKKYALAGASLRCYYMFAKPMIERFSEDAKIVGVYDINHKRARIFADDLKEFKAYDDFDQMLEETSPDVVLITTVDAFHHEYIIRSMEAGCDVITEKPMTIDAEKCKAVLETEKRTGRKLIVTFNYRFAPYVTKVKEILKTEVIGDILSVDFEWMLELKKHGSSYFRRWNRYMGKSGGLLVHKSTHHFDLINWWIESEPADVFAFGDLKMHGSKGKIRGENCRKCKHKDVCEYYVDITKDEFTTKFFTAAEDVDGYNKDKCVFDMDIDIYDTMSVNVRYTDEKLLTYSLNAHSPYEGWRVAINGSKGRIEAEIIETGIETLGVNRQVIKVFREDGTLVKHEVPVTKEGHGGGDVRLQRMLFKGDLPDPLGHMAGSKAGADSIMIGACANVSIKEKRMVNIQDSLK